MVQKHKQLRQSMFDVMCHRSRFGRIDVFLLHTLLLSNKKDHAPLVLLYFILDGSTEQWKNEIRLCEAVWFLHSRTRKKR